MNLIAIKLKCCILDKRLLGVKRLQIDLDKESDMSDTSEEIKSMKSNKKNMFKKIKVMNMSAANK